MLLPFSPDVGVAAIRQPSGVVAYFDEARPLDLSAFQADPTFSRATVLMQPNYTELVLPIGPDQTVHFSRAPEGWRLALGDDRASVMNIPIETSKGELHFLISAPGRVLTVPDPASGATLLVGTDRLASSALVPARRSTNFILKRSEIGVFVAALSDRLSLRPIRGGFALFRDDGVDLAFTDRMPPASRASLPDQPRSFSVAPGSDRDQVRQLDQQRLAAAEAPARARLSPRLAVAQTMIALGMEREARTVLRVAFADDPDAQADPQARWLRAIAEALSDPERASSLEDPSLPPTDETRLWRALTSASGRPSTEGDLAAIRTSIPLLLSYPNGLRDVAASLAAPILLGGASHADLDAIEQLPSISGTTVIKANAVALHGDGAKALARLDALADDRDLKTSSDAILSAALLRARLHLISPASAADTLALHRLDWRATGQEGSVIMQEAELRRLAGQWPRAVELWREAERRPDLADRARAQITSSLAALADPSVAAKLSPAEFVRVIGDCARELASRSEVATRLAPILADRLATLDLPAHATDVLREVLDATGPGPTKAAIGAKLASLLMEQNDLAGAHAVLDGSDAPGLPPELDRDRHLLLARVLDQQGAHDEALAAIAHDDSAQARNCRAAIYAAQGRWHEAKLTLSTMSERFPKDGILQRDQADIVLRLATAASRDGDTDLLLRLARLTQGRFPDPDQQQSLDLMTAPLSPPAAASAGSG